MTSSRFAAIIQDMSPIDIFASAQAPKSCWVVICGEPDSDGQVSILRDSIPNEGTFYLTFSSQEQAEREAKAMNRLRAGMKLPEIYSAKKAKPEWLDGLRITRI